MIYKFTIAPKGAMGTPLRSDTLFGHACWSMRLNESEERFNEFISNASAQHPELVFTGGFPEGWFPRPLIPVQVSRSHSVEEHRKSKIISKMSWVKFEEAKKSDWDLLKLQQLSSATSNTTTIGEREYTNQPVYEPMLRNVIDRMTGTSLSKNGLYNTGAHWYAGIWETVDIFVSTKWDQGILSEFIETMFTIGYGRDQTAGMGAVELVKKPEPFSFPSVLTEWYLSLSHAVPCEKMDLQQSFYQLETKYGKVWSALEKQQSPFKKVLLQTVPGSVFKIKIAAETAGCVLQNIHDNAAVIENCKSILYPLPPAVVKEVIQC
jgi:CRISPR-associated protein Csm4